MSLSSSHQGLSLDEVSRRRSAGQGNNVKLETSRSYWQIFRENIFTFINIVFFTISLVMLLLQRYGDAFLVVAIIGTGIVISVIQEIWAKRKLDEIALLNRPHATVIRDGQLYDVEPGEIVLGDLLLAQAGDQILVDGTIVGDGRIDADESLLTGESDLIPKTDGNEVFSGSTCVAGKAVYEAQKVGVETVAYKLMTGARAFRQVYTPLQQEINLVIRVLLLLACFLWILVGISFLSKSYSLSDVVQHAAVVAGLVPSGLLIAITLAYGTGAVGMLGKNVLIQQANAVESLSNVDVLCLDKTGTLTANQINLETVIPIGISEDELWYKLGDYVANVTSHNRTTDAIAVVKTGQKRDIKQEVLFTSARKWSAIAIADDGVYVLGAPEFLAKSMQLDEDIASKIDQATGQGLRVLLFAFNPHLESLASQDNPPLPANLSAVGVIIFSDQLRDNVQETIDQFIEAGIKIKIISGDNPETVAAIARQAGLGKNMCVISGLELAQMDAAQFAAAATTGTVFGRITPEQKAGLIKALRQDRNYVAMIGDGVNDILSLKQANLAISMESGSKATRSVADIILLKDSFAALPHAFLEGQRIRNGIRDSLALFIVRVFCVALLIFSIGMVTDSFPLVNKHSALLAMFGVGLPTAVFPIWAKPGKTLRKRNMVRSLLHFTIPATLSMTIVALIVYLLYLVRAIIDLPVGVEFSQVDYRLPRTALVTILVMCHLLLLPFLKPPSKLWVGGEPLNRDWRYTIASLVLFITFIAVLIIPETQKFFELAQLNLFDFIFLILIALEWCFIQRAIWRSRFLDKFLGVDLS